MRRSPRPASVSVLADGAGSGAGTGFSGATGGAGVTETVSSAAGSASGEDCEEQAARIARGIRERACFMVGLLVGGEKVARWGRLVREKRRIEFC